jgi:hypothetical protein
MCTTNMHETAIATPEQYTAGLMSRPIRTMSSPGRSIRTHGEAGQAIPTPSPGTPTARPTSTTS